MNTDEPPASRVVLDTNVLVSAALSDGPPYELLTLAEDGQLEVVTSPAILTELRDVLRRDRLPFEGSEVDAFVGKVIDVCTVVEPDLELEVVPEDPDDDAIVECAVAADAGCIVSGDSHLLDLGSHDGIPVHSPATARDRLAEERL